METYTAGHFSLTMPEGKEQDNLPELMRKVAKIIEEHELEVQDIVFHNELEAGKDRPMFTIYYSLPEDAD